MRKSLLFFFASCFFLLPPALVAAQPTYPEAKIFDFEGKKKASFIVFDANYEGATSLAAGDVDGDGKSEMIISSAESNRGEIWSFSGKKVSDFSPFGSFRGGIDVAAADIDGDGKAEIIAGAGYGGGPHIIAFSDSGNKASFFAFDKNSRSGVRVAGHDLGTDGKSEMLGFSGLNRDPELALFGNDGHLIRKVSIKAINRNGVNATIGDFNGDGQKEIVAAGGQGNSAQIFIFNKNLEQIGSFIVDGQYKGGLNLAAGNVTGDAKDEIIVSQSFNGGGKVIIFDMSGSILGQFSAYDDGFSGGVKVAIGDFDGDGKQEIATLPERISQTELKSKQYKFIEVSLKEQRLSYWQDGKRLGSFLISSGLPKTPTPKGEFSIFKKRPNVRMSWYYGPNNPNNYDLPNVPWVASFKGPYTIHGAYWHNNFGHPMSHGCVNMKNSEAKTVYDWVDIGTPIIIY